MGEFLFECILPLPSSESSVLSIQLRGGGDGEEKRRREGRGAEGGQEGEREKKGYLLLAMLAWC